MTKNHKHLAAFLMICMAVLAACNLPVGAPNEPAAGNEGIPSPTFTPLAGDAITSTPVPVPVQNCNPTATVTSQVANVRGGPDTVYNILGTLSQGASAPVAGKNFDGTWWYIEFAGGPGGYGWIAGSITSATCIPGTLAVIAAPPTPIIPTGVPSNTPVPGSPPSVTPTWSIFLIDPPIIFFIASSTPTPLFEIPEFEFPDIDIPGF